MITVNLQKVINTSYLLGAIALITMPDTVLDLLSGLIHYIFEFLHLVFETIEMLLDHLVEHLFHTDLRQTQIIVFYILVTLGSICSYFLWRGLRSLYYDLKEKAIIFYNEKKTQASIYWVSQSSIGKLKLIAMLSSCVTFIVMFGF